MPRCTVLATVGLLGAMQVVAQIPQLRFSPFGICGSADAGEGGSGGRETEDEIRKLIKELPRGEERDIARDLLNTMSGGRLPGFCTDPRSRALVVTESDWAGHRIVLGNRSSLRVQVEVARLPEDGGFGYLYRVSNLADARASIMTWGVLVPDGNRVEKETHPVWMTVAPTVEPSRYMAVRARQSTEVLAGPAIEPGRELARWSTPSEDLAIQPGRSQLPFGLRSGYRPGWTIAYAGSAEFIELPDGPVPEALEAGLDWLARPENYYSSALTIGPKFGPEADRTWVAGDWYQGIDAMVATGRLSAESGYVASLKDSLGRIARSASKARVPLTTSGKPREGIEASVDRAVRMALR